VPLVCCGEAETCRKINGLFLRGGGFLLQWWDNLGYLF
jgi:hypothetical protein